MMCQDASIHGNAAYLSSATITMCGKKGARYIENENMWKTEEKGKNKMMWWGKNNLFKAKK